MVPPVVITESTNHQKVSSPPAVLLYIATDDVHDGAEVQALASAWADALDTVEVSPIASIPTQLPSDTRVLVLYDRAQTAICAALNQGENPIQALAAWSDRVQALLPALRRNRRKITLIEAVDLCRASPCLRQQIASRLQLELTSLPPLNIPHFEPDPVHLVIATQIVQRNAVAASLDGELDALALSSSDGDTQEGVVERAVAELADLKQKLNDHQSQLAAAQRQEQDSAHLELQLSKVVKALEDKSDLYARAQQELAVQLLQLHALQDELDKCYLQKCDLERAHRNRWQELQDGQTKDVGQVQKIATLQQALVDKDAQLDAVWQSTSWRITQPIRSLKLAFTARNHK